LGASACTRSLLLTAHYRSKLRFGYESLDPISLTQEARYRGGGNSNLAVPACSLGRVGIHLIEVLAARTSPFL
jgi:hypothetical protein